MKLMEMSTAPGTDSRGHATSNPDGTIDIPKEALPKLQHELDKLNRRAAKLNVPPVKVDILKTYNKTIKSDSGIDQDIPFIHVSIEGEPIQIEGYDFIAVIQHKGAGNVIRPLPGYENENLSEFREADPNYCDHCKTNRKRNDTFLVRDQKTGEVRQVGRTCLKDFLHNADPKSILFWASLKDKVYNLIGDEDRWMGSGKWTPTPHTVMRAAIPLIDKYGYTSYSSGGTTTSDMVKSVVFGSTDPDTKKWVDVVRDSDQADVADKIEKVMNWINSKDESELQNNQYYSNMKVLLNSNSAEYRDVGIIASSYFAYNKAIGREEKQKKSMENKSNEWVGTPGDKIGPVEVKVVMTKYISGYYGDIQLAKMEDEDGNSYTWFNSSRNEMEKDGIYTIKGTIKSHDEFKGRKSTVLTRVKFLEKS